jgi:hypothetical protein
MRPAALWRRYDRLAGSDPAADVRDELRFHLETKVDDLVAHGWSLKAARKEAERQFGDILAVQRMGERIVEHMDRRRRLADYWADARWDLRFTLRSLRRDSDFAVVAILILALGIGANIAVFSVVNTILLRPLPFPHAEQLVRLHQKDPNGGDSSMTYSTDAMQAFQKQNESFQQVTGCFAFSGPDDVKLTGHGQPQPVTGMMVAGNFFSTLGVTPALGRNFTAEETLKNSRPVALLSYPFWKRQYAAAGPSSARLSVSTAPRSQ